MLKKRGGEMGEIIIRQRTVGSGKENQKLKSKKQNDKAKFKNVKTRGQWIAYSV